MYPVNLEQPEAQLILNVLAQLPYQQVAPLIAKLTAQFRAVDDAQAVSIDIGGQWEKAARELLTPEQVAQLEAAVAAA